MGNSTAVIYKDYKRQKLTIPYGFEFNSKQQVVDFLIGYQRFLVAKGFIFDEFDRDFGNKKDFVLSGINYGHMGSTNTNPDKFIQSIRKWKKSIRRCNASFNFVFEKFSSILTCNFTGS